VRAGGGLEPSAAVRAGVAQRDAAHQQNDLGQHQFGHAPRVGEGSVEHGNATRLRAVEIHLVGADAEAADADEPGRRRNNFRRQLRRRADAHEVGVADGFAQLRLWKRFRMVCNIGVAVRAEGLDGSLVHALEHQNLDLRFFQ
jgi:hypothetical protein